MFQGLLHTLYCFVVYILYIVIIYFSYFHGCIWWNICSCVFSQEGALRCSPSTERHQMKQSPNLKQTSSSQQNVCALEHTSVRAHFTGRRMYNVWPLCCSPLTEDGFSNSRVRKLLSPKKAAGLIALPTGCLEQTMGNLAPTASAIRYLDLSDQWSGLPVGARDDALDNLEKGRTTGYGGGFNTCQKLNFPVSSPLFIWKVWM